MSKPDSALGTFFRELRRRKVLRVAVVYAVVGWVLIQVAQTIFPTLHLPAWTVTLVVVFVFIGFPIALIVAWALELTPEGVKRTEALDLFSKTCCSVPDFPVLQVIAPGQPEGCGAVVPLPVKGHQPLAA
jgi:hypothetical protein